MNEMPVKMTMLVRRFYEEIRNNAEFDKLDEILDPKTSGTTLCSRLVKFAALRISKIFWKCFVQLFPDLHITVEDQIQENEQVDTRFAIGPRIEET